MSRRSPCRAVCRRGGVKLIGTAAVRRRSSRRRAHGPGRDPGCRRNPLVRLFAKLEAPTRPGSVKDRVARVPDRGPRGGRPAASRTRSSSSRPRATPASRSRMPAARATGSRWSCPTTSRGSGAGWPAVGAEVMIAGCARLNGAIALAKQLVAKDARYVMPYQYGNPANPRAHDETTGPEILDAARSSTCSWPGLGTGGTLTGVGRFLRRAKPGVRIVAAEPLPGRGGPGPALARRRVRARGLRPDAARRAPRLEPRAVRRARELLEQEGIFAGPSSGAILSPSRRGRQRDGAGHDRRAPARRRLEVPLGGHVLRPLDDMEDALEGGVSWW